MKWLWFAGLIVVFGFLLRSYLRSGHLKDHNADQDRWTNTSDGSGGGGLGGGN